MMRIHPLLWFFCAFCLVVGFGSLMGCADPQTRLGQGPDHIAFCGMARCDGKPIKGDW